MKKIYIILLFFLICTGFFIGITLIKIPTPQVKINEEYKLNIQ